MKTLINILTALTAMTLVSGATAAMADQQRSDEAAGYALSHEVQNGSGPYASARGEIRNGTVNVPSTIDFQAQGRN